jgi:hypothetical protein
VHPLPPAPPHENPNLLPLGPVPTPASALLTPDEVRLIAHHAAAYAIGQATLTGSPLLDLLSGPAEEQVRAYLLELARGLSSTRLSSESRSQGECPLTPVPQL